MNTYQIVQRCGNRWVVIGQVEAYCKPTAVERFANLNGIMNTKRLSARPVKQS